LCLTLREQHRLEGIQEQGAENILTEEGLNGRMPEGNRPLGRPRWRWENNIKMDVR
jgi:hypothetical protein